MELVAGPIGVSVTVFVQILVTCATVSASDGVWSRPRRECSSSRHPGVAGIAAENLAVSCLVPMLWE